MNSRIRHTLFPVLAAAIWGTAFVAQSVSTEYVRPFTFNMLRSVIAFLVLLVILGAFRLMRRKAAKAPGPRKTNRKALLLGGLCCGTALTAASYLQQAGLGDTSAGKAGFITALYIVLVPVFGLFLHKRVSLPVWAAVAAAVVGLYLLCVRENFTISPGDGYVFACALIFAVHILLIDRFAGEVDGIALSCVQFAVMAVLSGIGALFFETIEWAAVLRCLGPILYVGIFSSGVAYTLQILAQKDADPTVVSLLLSLESVFSVLAGAVILHERLSGREYLGCIFMFIAVVLAQLPSGKLSELFHRNRSYR